jgi:hypothetical protein
MEYQIYYDVYYEWLKFMTHLGKMIAIGFNDMQEKANCLKTNREIFSEKYKFF